MNSVAKRAERTRKNPSSEQHKGSRLLEKKPLYKVRRHNSAALLAEQAKAERHFLEVFQDMGGTVDSSLDLEF